MKFTPGPSKPNGAIDLRPPSRQKNRNKTVGIDDLFNGPQTPPKHLNGKNFTKNESDSDDSFNFDRDDKGKALFKFILTIIDISDGFNKRKSQKEYDLLDELECKDANYKGTEWFFESHKKENTEDFFKCIDFQNVVEMEGILPQDDTSHFIDDDDHSKNT